MYFEKKIIKNKLLLFTGLIMPCQILAYKVVPFFLLPLLASYFFILYNNQKIKIRYCGLMLMVATFVNFLSGMSGNLPYGWKESSRNQIVEFIALIFILFLSCAEEEIIDLIRGIRYGVLLNIWWSYAQFLIIKILKLDINNIVFNNILSIREQASTINTNEGVVCITGLNWHPAQLIPIIIIGYLMYDSFWMKVVLFGLAYISTNTTCMVALVICVFLDIFYRKIWISKKIKSSVVFSFFLIICIASVMIIYLYKNGLMSDIYERISYMISRFTSIFGVNKATNSTKLHLRYYTSYPRIIRMYGLRNAIFGLGFDCSGYPFVELYHQYASLKSWRVESDIINFLVGRGILWTMIYYGILIKLLIKGKEISRKYFIMLVCFMACGVLYNTQVLWVEAFMLFLSIVVDKKMDIFLCHKDNNFFVKLIKRKTTNNY